MKYKISHIFYSLVIFIISIVSTKSFAQSANLNTSNENILPLALSNNSVAGAFGKNKKSDFASNPKKIISVKEISLSVYPNPFHKVTTVDYFLSDNASVVLSILDLSGNETSRIEEKQTEGHHRYILDVGNLEQGMYCFVLIVNDQAEARKMILVD